MLMAETVDGDPSDRFVVNSVWACMYDLDDHRHIIVAIFACPGQAKHRH